MNPTKISPAICAATAAILTLFLLSLVGFRLTWSGSVPRGLYLTTGQPIEHGVLVVACLPPDVARWAVGRGYLRPGSCPGNASAVGKPVHALAGDLVEVDEDAVSINGQRLRRSRRALSDSLGRPMPRFDEGLYRLAAGELWLYSAHHDRSLDSRVYGPIRTKDVREVLVPIWVEGSP